jgi:hypothetical protein
MQQEEQVAQIEEIEKPLEEKQLSEEELKEKKKRRDLKIEMALFFILGVLIGITIKTEAVKNVTIGFNDYQLKNGKQAYNIDQIKADLDKEMQNAQAAQQNAQEGGSIQAGQPDSSQPAVSQPSSVQPQ